MRSLFFFFRIAKQYDNFVQNLYNIYLFTYFALMIMAPRYRLFLSGKDLARVMDCSVRTAYRHFERIRTENGLKPYEKITSLQIAKYLQIDLIEVYNRL